MSNARGHRQERTEPRDGDDFAPTPPWATRALLPHIKIPPGSAVLEPACGNGAMAAVLVEAFDDVHAYDLVDRGYGGVQDFLAEDAPIVPNVRWIITNPPFNRLDAFIHTALTRYPTAGVAMLSKTTALGSQGRYRQFYADRFRRPSRWLQFVDRLNIAMNRFEPGRGGFVEFGWMIWDWPRTPVDMTGIQWIAPCRVGLEIPEWDYKRVPPPGQEPRRGAQRQGR